MTTPYDLVRHLVVENGALVAFAAALLAARFYFSLPAVKGARGEARVARRLRADLEETDYTVLHDLTLPTRDGTTQIDHVVLSPFGVFVIETKNMDGWIFGSERQAQWTQTFGRNKWQFQNPLRQNFKHVKAVEDVLGVPQSIIRNVVLFVGSAKPKTSMPVNVLWSIYDLTEYITAERIPVFSKPEAKSLAERLRQAARAPGRTTRRDHVEGLKTRFTRESTETPACPQCRSPMIKRTNKKTGALFFGCSNFPRCRGMRRYAEPIAVHSEKAAPQR